MEAKKGKCIFCVFEKSYEKIHNSNTENSLTPLGIELRTF